MTNFDNLVLLLVGFSILLFGCVSSGDQIQHNSTLDNSSTPTASLVITQNESIIESNPSTSQNNSAPIYDLRSECSQRGGVLIPVNQSGGYNTQLALSPPPKNAEIIGPSNETCVDPKSNKELVFRNQCKNLGWVFVPNADASQYSQLRPEPCVAPNSCFDSEGNLIEPAFVLNETCVNPNSTRSSPIDISNQIIDTAEKARQDCLANGDIIVPTSNASQYQQLAQEVGQAANETCVNPNLQNSPSVSIQDQCAAINGTVERYGDVNMHPTTQECGPATCRRINLPAPSVTQFNSNGPLTSDTVVCVTYPSQ